MSTAYQYDEQGIYTGAVEFDPEGALPTRSTSLKPPKTTGKKVAQWMGGEWAVLAAAPDPVLPSPAEISKQYEAATQRMLDAAAVAEGFDSISTAISYAEEPAVPKFQAAGRRFRAWRSLVWAYAYDQLALVLAGGREQPTVEAFLLELPVLELPA